MKMIKILSACVAIMLLFTAGTVQAAGLTLHTEISGITGSALQNTQARLNAIQESYGNDLTIEDIQSYAKYAAENIRIALQPFGYFKADVETQLTHQDSQWTVHFIIHPGTPVTITSVTVTLSGAGAQNTELQKVKNNFPLARGQIFKAEQYENAKQLLFETANKQGYLKAFLEKKEIRINIKSNSAMIILNFNTGPRYYFGAVNFNKTPFAPHFLQRFVPFKEGEPFSSEKLLAFQQGLRTSNYFQDVTVVPNISETENSKTPVNVTLVPRKSQQYTVGVGYGTFTGPRITVGADLRRTTDTGHYFTTEAKYSSVLKELSANYFIPGKNPLTDKYSLGANIQKYLPKNGESFSEKLSASYLKNGTEWHNAFALNYLTEHYFVEEEPSRQSNLLIPSINISRTKADDPVNATTGNKLNLILQGSSQYVLSTTDFVQGEIKGKYIFSPTSASRVILRGDLGYTVVKDLEKLPLSLRFFAGGIDSVRGFPYDNLGPGRYLKVGSVEYQHRIVDKWSGAVFYDVGNASNNFTQPLERGAGVGVLYKSFIGPVKLYVARAETRPGHPFSVEFSIGPDF